MNKVNGILLIYHHPFALNAPTIMEHINAFEQHSRFKVWKVNTELRFPKRLNKLRFAVIVLHYSLFGYVPFSLHKPFYEYVERSTDSYKVAFFQDEYRYWPERVNLLNKLNVDTVYTLVEPSFFDDTYGKLTSVRKLVYNLPAYVNKEATNISRKFFKPDSKRTIDVGYRGRRPAYYLGRGGQEKYLIAKKFQERSAHLGLHLDIETNENKRIYGKAWINFLANCKAVLGVEAGSSIFDIDNVVRPQYETLVEGHPDMSFPECNFEEVYETILALHEEKIYYRTISARHFEVAALRVCQILFEGKYSGILKPMTHYIPLKKDFSNFDEVIKMFKDKDLRKELAENAYIDLIASEKYSYKKLIENFDEELLTNGISAEVDLAQLKEVTMLLNREKMYNYLYGRFTKIRQTQFPGRKIMKPLIKPFFDRLGI